MVFYAVPKFCLGHAIVENMPITSHHTCSYPPKSAVGYKERLWSKRGPIRLPILSGRTLQKARLLMTL